MLLNKFIFLNICFIISLGNLFSQGYSISGIVLDFKSKEPVNNVSIYIENSIFGTSTDEDGLFILYLENKSRDSTSVSIRMIGYVEQTFKINVLASNHDLGKIYLKEQLLESSTVHIHSNRSESNQISNMNLSGQKLNDNLSSNLALTLSKQPNIGVSSFGAATSKPVLRGYSGDRFLLTKEGSDLGDLSQSSIDHAITLDMSEVTKIEIIRGPKTLLYGSNAIGGVINTTISGNPEFKVDKFYRNFVIGGESYNKGLNGKIMFYIPFKNNQFNFSLNSKNASNQSSPIGTLENTYFEASNLKFSYTKYNERNYFNFVAENYDMSYGIPPSLEGHIDGVDINLFKKTYQFNYHQDISLNNFDQFDVKYNFIDYEHKEFENNTNYYSVLLSKVSQNFKMEIQSYQNVLGLEINYKKFSPGGFYWTPTTNQLNFSLYGFNETEYSDIDLLSSFRISYLTIEPDKENLSFSNLNIEDIKKRSFEYISSSIGIKKMINKFEINSWIMGTMRAPRIEELYSDGPHLGTYSYEIGFPDLGLEKIYGLESSIGYDHNSLEVSLTNFYNYSPYYYQLTKMGNCEEEFIIGQSHPCAGSNFIEWGSGSSGWLYKYQSKGIESVIKGLEFNLSYRYNYFKLVYDFSLSRGNNLTDQSPLSYINPDKQTLNLEYEKNLINYKIRLSKTHAQDRLGEFESYTSSSFLIDFIVSYSIESQNITVQFNNILNEEYYNHLSKIKSIMPEAGRNIILSYKIFF
tara:strand:- start:655 stop:2895 length:2241 start_codon:yes stop_codon:yes gene_type:complete